MSSAAANMSADDDCGVAMSLKSLRHWLKLQQDFLMQYRVRVVLCNDFCAMRHDGLCDLLIT